MSPRHPFVTAPALSDHNYVALHDRDQTFTNLATFSTFDGGLVGAGDPVVIKAGSVTTEFFDVLGVPAAYGRTFNADDGKTGVEQTVVLGNALWKERYGGDMSVLGRDVTLNGVRRVVIGIMPAGFEFPAGVEAWTPQVVRLSGGNSMMFPVIGRLKPDVTVDQARAQFDSVRRDLPRSRPRTVLPGRSGSFPSKSCWWDTCRPLSIFVGAVIFVLLVACANVAHLLLARGAHRRRELAGVSPSGPRGRVSCGNCSAKVPSSRWLAAPPACWSRCGPCRRFLRSRPVDASHASR